MTCSTKRICSVALVSLLFMLSASTPSWGVNSEPIGSITAIEGDAWLGHQGEEGLYPANLGDPVYLHDHIQTDPQSRVQILFQDESLLNLAENTTIQITEHIYSPEKRSSVFRLLMGKVRAIVGRYFPGAGSRYEIHTPTAIIGVRGTHFVVDATFTDETTVVCLDTSGGLAVRNIRGDVAGEVILTGGLMTKVLEGQPPTPPVPAREDLMMQLLRDTRVTPPTLQGGPVELRGLLGKKKAAVTMSGVIREEGKLPPIPPAPDAPLFRAVTLGRPPELKGGKLPPPPPPPPR
jgi:hypothetical protein